MPRPPNSSSPSPGPGAPPGAHHRAPGFLVFLLVLVTCLGLAPGFIDNIDTRIAFRSAQAFLSTGSFALPDPTGMEERLLWTGRGLDGRIYSKFGVGESVTLLPFVLAGRILAPLLPLEGGKAEELAAALSSSLFTAIAAFFLVRILAGHLRLSPTAAVVGTLAWAFGTFQLSYSGSSYLETPLMAATVLACWAGLRSRCSDRARYPVLCGLFTGWAVAVKVAMVVYVPFLLIPLLARNRSVLLRRALLAGIPLAAIAVWLMAVNWVRFGGPLATGYVQFSTLFETPLHVGLAAYGWGVDHALLLFAPALAIGLFGLPALFRRSPALFWTAAGVFASGTILHALHTGYHGGTAYGPRYLLSTIPLLTAPGIALLWSKAHGRWRSVLIVLVLLCVLLQVPSALVSPTEYHTIRSVIRERGREMDTLSPRVVTDARLLHLKVRGVNTRYDLRELIPDPVGVPEDPVYEVPRIERGFAVWWLFAAREGIRAAVIPGMALLFTAVLVAWILRRRLRQTP